MYPYVALPTDYRCTNARDMVRTSPGFGISLIVNTKSGFYGSPAEQRVVKQKFEPQFPALDFVVGLKS